jgi:hypothetical protein
MPTTRLVIPLLNVSSTLFEIPKWHLAEDVYLSQISDEDFATLHREAEEQYVEWLKARTICINLEDPPSDAREEHARSIAIMLSFVFNAFASESPLIVSKAAYIDKQPASHHSLSVDLQSAPVGAALAKAVYGLRPLANPEPLVSLFKVVRAVFAKNPAILVTLDRFNSSLVRANPYDQIIDITISLESIVESSTEIKFRFSLYNSLVAEPDTMKRRATFEMFETLYDARSAIIHGDIKSRANAKKIEATRQSMRDIHKAAVAVVSYYLMYQFKERKTPWKDHMDRLALGEETRVTD